MNEPIHVAITRKVKPGREAEFESAIRHFFAESLRDSPTLGVQLLRPLPGSDDRVYGILRSFASERDRDEFYHSPSYLKWEKAVAPLVEGDYSRRDLHGLEAFFRDPGLIHRPPRWKMAIITWLAVWPSVSIISSLVAHRLSGLHPVLITGVITMLVVFALTWVVMPWLTRLVRPWLEHNRLIRARRKGISHGKGTNLI